jgi:hypothetical protein
MIGMEGPGVRNEMMLVPLEGTTGMETSYARLEREVLGG